MNEGGRQIPGLDLLRFAAAAMVMLYHFGRATPAAGAFSFGWAGVEIFFTLSGFVIAYSAQGATAASFARSRFVRLAPGIWLCATLSLALLLWSGQEGKLIPYLKTLVLWPTGPWIDTVYWTLPVEVAFYLLVFLVVAAGAKSRLGAVLMTLGWASTLYWLLRLVSTRYDLPLWSNPFPARYLLLEHGCFFALGGLLWACLLDKPTKLRIACAAVFAGTGLVETLFAHNAFDQGGSPLAAWLSVIAGIGAIVAAVRFNRPGRWAPQARLIGLTTYPLYLLHNTAGVMLLAALLPLMPAILALAAAALATILLSLAVAAWPEPHLQARLRRLLGSPSPGPAARTRPSTPY